jgi:hypothetical protein
MDESTEAYVALAKRLLAIALFALAVMIIVAAIDYRLKRDIVREADAWREQIRGVPPEQQPQHWRQPQPEQQRRAPARPAVPDPNYVQRPVDPLANGAAAAAGDDDRPPIPIVSPGNETARPPHRGAVNG